MHNYNWADSSQGSQFNIQVDSTGHRSQGEVHVWVLYQLDTALHETRYFKSFYSNYPTRHEVYWILNTIANNGEYKHIDKSFCCSAVFSVFSSNAPVEPPDSITVGHDHCVAQQVPSSDTDTAAMLSRHRSRLKTNGHLISQSSSRVDINNGTDYTPRPAVCTISSCNSGIVWNVLWESNYVIIYVSHL